MRVREEDGGIIMARPIGSTLEKWGGVALVQVFVRTPDMIDMPPTQPSGPNAEV